MGTDLGRLLHQTRTKNKKTLKESSGGEFSQQALSNYERGTALPPPEKLERLARCYALAPETVTSAYLSSTSQARAGPIPEEPFLNAVKSASKGDHFVAITQRPLLAERPELALNVLELLKVGGGFTYVTYIPGRPEQRTEGWSERWDTTHAFASRVIWQAVRNADPELAAGVRYLLVGNPSPSDYAFLRAFGATTYLCRRKDSDYQHSQVWSELRSPDGRHWWQPCDQGFEAALHDWLVFDCGISLPTTEIDLNRAKGATERNVRIRTLEQFLSDPRVSSDV